MLKKRKKIAFVFGRVFINTAKLQYMPFALSTLKKIAEDGNCEIDVFVTQSKTEDYKKLLPENVTFNFIDKDFIWSRGGGRKFYFLITLYFQFITFFKKYDTVFGVSQVGVVLGGKLAARKRANFICLNDEFPSISYFKIWREHEIKYTAKASIVILPDECRIDVLKKQISFNEKTAFFVLPNIPLENEFSSIKQIDWKTKLNLRLENKIIVYAGGISRENNIDYLLSIFPLTDSKFVLIMIGNNPDYINNRYLKNDRILWLQTPLNDHELHDIISEYRYQ